MDDLRKQIFLDLCVTPGTMIPSVLGGTMLLLAFAGLGGSAAFFGIICLLVGLGALATNIIFRLESVSQHAVKKWRKQQSRKINIELDQLDEKLTKTKEKRDEVALRNLRSLYDSFVSDHSNGKISSSIPATMFGQIDEIFQVCIHQLKISVDVYNQYGKVTGDLKKTLKKQHGEIVDDVVSGVETLAVVINEVRALSYSTNRRDLKRIQEKLNSQLKIAKATEEQVATLEDIGNEDTSRFSEYE